MLRKGMCVYAGSLEHSLVAYAISTIYFILAIISNTCSQNMHITFSTGKETYQHQWSKKRYGTRPLGVLKEYAENNHCILVCMASLHSLLQHLVLPRVAIV